MEVRQANKGRTEFIVLCTQLIIQSVVTALVGASDAIMTGALDQAALSAITLGGQVMQLYSYFIMALCIGSTVLSSQYYGLKDIDSIRKVMNITLKASFSGAMIFFLSALTIPQTIMRFFTNEDTLIALGTPYLRMISPAFLFMGFSQIYMNVMKNTGRAKYSAMFGSITSVLNIVLNYMLIFGRFGLPQLGVLGAALATSVARAIELILSVYSSRKGYVSFSLNGFFKSNRGIRRKFWRYTLPSLLQMSSWKLASTASIAIVGHLGSDIVAASSYAIILYSILCSISDGYGFACGIKIGRYLGQGETQKAKLSGDSLLTVSQILAVCVGGITCLCCPFLIRANPAMSDAARAYLKTIIFFTGFRCIGKFFNTTLASGIFSAGGDVMYLLKLDIINMWLVMLPLGLISAYVLHLPPLAVYFVLNLDEFYKLWFMYRRYKNYFWVKNLTKKEWASPGHFEESVRSEVFRIMPLGVIVVSAAGRISMANAASAEILGKTLEEIEGGNYIDFFMNDEENAEFADLVIEAVNDKKNTHEAIVNYNGKNGTFPVRVKSSFLEDEDCRMGICLMLSKE